MKKIALAVLLAIGSASVMAGEVYSQIGTEGLGLGYAHAISDKINIRGEYNHFSKSYTQDSGDLSYEGKLKLGGASILGDYFPFSNGFRLTGGLVFNQGEISGSATGKAGTYNINGTTYAYAGGDRVDAKVKFGDVSPYLGIGFGHKPKSTGFGFFADVGVIVLNPKTSVTVSGDLATRVSSEDIEAERRSLQNDADKLKAYPVLKVGVSYAF
jgi:hypothetical protein